MAKRAARGEQLGPAQAERLETDLAVALKRKPSNEGRLAGAIRELMPYSPRLCESSAGSLATLVKRSSFGRPLYAALMRGLAEHDGRRATPLLARAMESAESGGLPTLSAACFDDDGELAEPLARAVTNRHPHLAFAAEVARVSRAESNGAHVTSVAPKIKESHRIALCSEVFVPLSWWKGLPVAIAPALSVLRGAERHLGRWLVLAEVATRAGDPRPLSEAREHAQDGPSSARAAWSMVAWALCPSEPTPSARPTVELIARLSDRPSSDRDTTFLFRLAAARAPTARPMLEGLVKGSALGNEAAIRAALFLLRDHGRSELRDALANAAKNSRKEALRGIAAAALFDAGEPALARQLATDLLASKQVCTVAWANLVAMTTEQENRGALLVDEPRYRRIQLGWPE